MFQIDDTDIKRLEQDLERFKHRALPFATKFTLNGVASKGRVLYQKEMDKDLIQRNKFTRNSARFTTTTTLNINKQITSIGSVAPYMDEQEFGGTKTTRGRHGVPLATSYSSGEGEGARPRKKLPRKPNKLRNINLRRMKRRPINAKQALLFKVQDSVASGSRILYHDKAMYRVVGGRKKFKRGWPKGAKLKMIYSLEKRSVRIPRNKMLEPAHIKAAALIPEEYRAALLFQVKKHGLFR